MSWLVIIYSSLGIFLIGTVYKVVRIMRLPVHLRWELSPVPGEKSKRAHGGSYLEDFEWWNNPRESSIMAQLKVMASEIFLFHGVWNNNRSIWLFTYCFHTAIYILAFALMGIVGAFFLTDVFLITAPLHSILSITSYIFVTGYAIGCFGTTGMFVRRITDFRLRSYSTFSTYFNLIILLAVFITGFAAYSTSADYGNEVYKVVADILTADSSISVSNMFSWHINSTLLFIVYLPFSFMIHFVAKYFTYHDIRWDDAPQNEKTERKISAMLKQRIAWSALHVNNGTISNWMETVTTENSDEKKS